MTARSLSAHLKRWSKQLEPVSDSPRLDTEILLKHASGLSDTQLITRDNEPLNDDTILKMNTLLRARSEGSPIAYLTGEREFYALKLKIDQHVLIPRPETELLVDIALDLVRNKAAPDILDLGTGSGAIALAIADNAITAKLVAIDIDDNALKIAAHNAQRHHVRNITFLSSNWYSKLENERFDLIVSNPPYIDPQDPHLKQGDVRFEPEHALISADRGRADIKQIIALAPGYLNSSGWIALEHGYDQGEIIRELLSAQGFDSIKTVKDLNQHDRVTSGHWPAHV